MAVLGLACLASIAYPQRPQDPGGAQTNR